MCRSEATGTNSHNKISVLLLETAQLLLFSFFAMREWVIVKFVEQIWFCRFPLSGIRKSFSFFFFLLHFVHVAMFNLLCDCLSNML